MAKATAQAIDFTGVTDGSRWKKLRQPQGDYKGKVVSVEDSPTKGEGKPQWVFAIKVGPGLYPYRCQLQPNMFWKVRNLLVAAGIKVPQKKVKVDPNVVVGKFVGVTLEDDEYNDRPISEINSVFPVSELTENGSAAEDDDDDEDEDEEEEAPPVTRKTKAAPVEEEDEEEEEEEEEEAPPPPKKTKAKTRKAPPPPPEDDDDDLDEIDIDDV